MCFLESVQGVGLWYFSHTLQLCTVRWNTQVGDNEEDMFLSTGHKYLEIQTPRHSQAKLCPLVPSYNCSGRRLTSSLTL